MRGVILLVFNKDGFVDDLDVARTSDAHEGRNKSFTLYDFFEVLIRPRKPVGDFRVGRVARVEIGDRHGLNK